MSAETTEAGGKGFDMAGMTRVWKESYLKGLDACLHWQEESEQLVKNTVRQGLSGPRQWLNLYKEWVEMPWDQIQGQTAGVPNPFLAFSRQSVQTCHATVEPLLKSAELALENSFGYYETALAAPSRKYVRELNRQVLDSLIPG